jgi:hypothetical protein
MLRSLRSNSNASKMPMVTRSSIQGGSISNELGEQTAPGEARTGRQIGGRDVIATWTVRGRRPASARSAGEGQKPRGPQRQTGHLPRHASAGRSVGRILPSPPGGCARAGRRRDGRGRRGQTQPVSQQRAESGTCLSPWRARGDGAVRSLRHGRGAHGPGPRRPYGRGGARTVAAGARRRRAPAAA